MYLLEAQHTPLSKLKGRVIKLYPDFDGDLLDDNIERNVTFTSYYDPDSDDDFFPDGAEYEYWEFAYIKEGISDFKPTGDVDGDGLSNILDYDSDGDGVPDGGEVENNLHPGKWDSDNDGLSDRYNFKIYYNTNLGDRDNDRDRLPDNWENYFGITRPDIDSDGDGVDNFHEWMNGSDPTVKDERYGFENTEDELLDSDFDGLTDKLERGIGLNPNNDDFDNDGLLDGEEYLYWSLPFIADTDGDNITDGEEVERNTSAYLIDSDKDKLQDREELVTDPLRPDSNKNLILDGDEFLAHDIDHDGLRNLIEMDDSDGFTTNPLDPDSDGDSIIDGEEDANHNGKRDGNDPTDSDSDWGHGGETDPNSADTDGGGLDDGFEIYYDLDPLDPEDDMIEIEPIPTIEPIDTPRYEFDPETCMIILTIIIILLVAIVLLYYFTHIKKRLIEEVIEILETAEKALYELDTSDAIRNAIYEVYRKFLRTMKKFHLTREESMTVNEFAIVVRSNLPLQPEPVQDLTGVFEEARYSDHVLGKPSKNRAINSFRKVRLELQNYQIDDYVPSEGGAIENSIKRIFHRFLRIFKTEKNNKFEDGDEIKK